MARPRLHGMQRVKTDPVELPCCKGARIVVPYTYLVRSSNVNRLDLELIFLSGLEVITAVVERNLVRLDRLSFLVLAVDHHLNVGVRSRSVVVGSVHQDHPRHHCHSETTAAITTTALR